jgi:hypothetical protein
MFHEDRSSELIGPCNIFYLEAPYYEILVDIDKMEVVGWFVNIVDWVKEALTDLPMKSEVEIIQIARNYAEQYFPHFHEFPEWETEIAIFDESEIARSFGLDKKVIKYIVIFSPFVTNEIGTKIPVLTTGCAVDIDPYEGKVIGFLKRHMPMTLTNLIPTFSPEEAKTLLEQAFLNLGAAKASAVMSSDDGLLDGLVVGATQTSGLRLAYLFDRAVTVGAPGYEERFGTEEEPQEWRAAIDAHTGELFYRQPILGSASEEARKILVHGSQRGYVLPFPQTSWWWISIGILVVGFLLLLWTRQRKRSKYFILRDKGLT